MKKIINRFICFMCIPALLLMSVLFAACDPAVTDPVIEVKATQTTLELEQSAVSGYDYTSLFTVTKDGTAVTVTAAMIDSTAVKAEAGTYTVKCTYEGKSADLSVTVKAAPSGGGEGETPTPGPTDTWADVHNAKATIKTHAEGTVTYRFQAECTDLRGKTNAPGYSGTASTYSDMAGGSASEAYVTYLYRQGLSLNFLVVADRDVESAELSLRLGAEFMIVPVTPDVFEIRVDRKVTDDDLYDVSDTKHEGARGAWDIGFLDYYKNAADTDRVTINTFECPATSKIDGTALSSPGNFAEFKITSRLSLKKGVNSVSIIIKGAAFVDSGNHGTMQCIAPVVDYMAIKTNAQLGFFGQQDNGYGVDGLSIVA